MQSYIYLFEKLESPLGVIMCKKPFNCAYAICLGPDRPSRLGLGEISVNLKHVRPCSAESPTIKPWSGKTPRNPNEMEGNHGTCDTLICEIEVLDFCEADEPFTVDQFVFVKVLKKRAPHGPPECWITVIRG